MDHWAKESLKLGALKAAVSDAAACFVFSLQEILLKAKTKAKDNDKVNLRDKFLKII
jgi:hypothetical protein